MGNGAKYISKILKILLRGDGLPAIMRLFPLSQEVTRMFSAFVLCSYFNLVNVLWLNAPMTTAHEAIFTKIPMESTVVAGKETL